MVWLLALRKDVFDARSHSAAASLVQVRRYEGTSRQGSASSAFSGVLVHNRRRHADQKSYEQLDISLGINWDWLLLTYCVIRQLGSPCLFVWDYCTKVHSTI